MASSSTTTPDTPVTIKINYDGTSRRFKLPLRDLGINVLEGKLRGLLSIPADANVIFERYSDSAASYVVLDQANTAVYKQLGRAAKAKQKLKIRVTSKKPVEEEKKGPKPASVEDAVEEEISTPQTAQAAEPIATPVVSPSSSTVPQETTPAATAAPARSEAQKRLDSMSDTLEAIQASITESNKVAQSLCGTARAPIAVSIPPPTASTCKAPTPRTNYAVCCNRCDEIILGSHFHCSTCDDGDYDLCQKCVDQGKVCNNSEHWMIKRCVENGIIVNSTTERIAPKPKPKPRAVAEAPAVPTAPSTSSHCQERIIPVFGDFLYSSIRTCNCCVQELPENEFVHCTTCDDFDLCRACFAKNRHGHHPKHAFVPAVEGTRLDYEVSRHLPAGRDQKHSAICDGCDVEIKGIRHKCLDCPDWDYCSICRENSGFVHPGHRFVPIYEPLEARTDARIRALNRPTHIGICCDGPLCKASTKSSTYIVGDRYKCAVCHDTDFCSSCEASPANDHNKTHPLIKFKTPVRHVSVTTTGEHENGRVMPTMGDKRTRSSVTSSRATETAPQNVFTTRTQTVVDVKPTEPAIIKQEEKEEIKAEEKPLIDLKAPVPDDLVAVFVRETVPDGTVLGPDHVFEQTWVLRNEGTVAWPAGCSVKYVGGDYMGHVDSTHPAATEDLESTSESTICYAPIAPGEEFPFTVLLRTPHRNGRIVSNWRLTTKDGMKFGHRLWCDIEVETPKPAKVEPEAEKVKDEVKEEKVEVQHSQMIFPKLDKESPVASVHQESMLEPAPTYEDDEYEDCAEDDAWAEDSSEAFMTDEEYDILDASDEEYNTGKK